MALPQEAGRASGRGLEGHPFLSVTPGGQEKGVWKALLSGIFGLFEETWPCVGPGALPSQWWGSRLLSGTCLPRALREPGVRAGAPRDSHDPQGPREGIVGTQKQGKACFLLRKSFPLGLACGSGGGCPGRGERAWQGAAPAGLCAGGHTAQQCPQHTEGRD